MRRLSSRRCRAASLSACTRSSSLNALAFLLAGACGHARVELVGFGLEMMVIKAFCLAVSWVQAEGIFVVKLRIRQAGVTLS